MTGFAKRAAVAPRLLAKPVIGNSSRSEEHTSEPSHDQISYAVFCLKKKKHTSELQSRSDIVCRLLLEKKKQRSHSNSCSVIWSVTEMGGVGQQPEPTWSQSPALGAFV